MTTVRLAVRNLSRAPRRTLLTMSAVIAGVGVFILGEAFVSGLTENVIMSAIDGTVGHVLARPAGYPLQPGQHPLDDLLTITPAARKLLDTDAVAWTERTYFAPTAASGADSLRAIAIGYDPQRDPSVFSRQHWRIEGRLPAEGADEVAVSPRVAHLLNMKVGSTLVLQVRTHRGAMNALEARVSALLATRNAVLDSLGIWVPARLAHSLLATEQPSHLSAKLARRDDAEAFALRLGKALGAQASVATWRSETAELVRIQDIRQRSLDLIMVILMTLAAFGIVNTILMAAYERVREIGTLRSLGMTERGVLRLFVLEGFAIGALGSVLGALWGTGLTVYWSLHPLDFSEQLQQMSGNNSVSALVYTRVSVPVILTTVLLGVVVAVLASIYPARVASRMAPADAVRAA